MKVETINEMIAYLMERPYKEVHQIMDKVKREVEEMRQQESNSAPLPEEEEVDG